MATVTLSELKKSYGRTEVIHGVDMDIADGEFIVIVGPSGCGKSTLLRMVAGLEGVTSGEVRIDGERVNEKEPMERDIAMVFQNYALYPHMSVFDNMAYGLKIAGTPRPEIRERVGEAARLLQLEEYLDRRPRQLSGGQRQRVAMGRAIVRQPQVFLMDEPLSNLDAKLRVQTRTQIASLQRRLGVTTVYVTHDQTEALTMGDRICVLKDGVLQQVGSPSDLYETPTNVFVAGFIGSPAMNLFPANVADGGVQFGSAIAPVSRDVLASTSEKNVTVGVRPEDLIINTNGEGLSVEIDLVEELGADGYLYGHIDVEGQRVDIVARVDGRSHPHSGETVYLTPEPKHVHVFDTASGKRLNKEPITAS